MSKLTVTLTGPSASTGHHVQVSIERDVESDVSNDERAELIKQDLNSLREAVKGEVAQPQKSSYSTDQNAGNGDSQHANSSNGSRASTKQVNFMMALSKRLGIDLDQLNSDASANYGAANIYDLSKRDASKFIDLLNAQVQTAKRAA